MVTVAALVFSYMGDCGDKVRRDVSKEQESQRPARNNANSEAVGKARNSLPKARPRFLLPILSRVQLSYTGQTGMELRYYLRVLAKYTDACAAAHPRVRASAPGINNCNDSINAVC
jgi:hypothetical protein